MTRRIPVLVLSEIVSIQARGNAIATRITTRVVIRTTSRAFTRIPPWSSRAAGAGLPRYGLGEKRACREGQGEIVTGRERAEGR